MTSPAPQYRFANTRSGKQVGYATVGEGVPLVLMPGSLVRLSIDYAEGWARVLPQGIRLVAYDHLGAGMSDREGYDFSPEGLRAELDAVLADAVEGRFILVGRSSAVPTAVRYAATHAERLHALLLLRPWLRTSDFQASEAFRSFRRSLEGEWISTSEALVGGVSALSFRERRAEAARLREYVDQSTLLDYLDTTSNDDASSVAAGVATPTYVLSNADDPLVPRELVQQVTRAIPGARLRLYDSDYIGETAAVVAAVIGRLDSESSLERRRSELSTILFTDVVSSTPLLSQLRDERMRQVMRDHDAVCEAAITEHGGRVVKTIGDAFMAEFSVPSAAIEAAIAIQRGVREQFADSDVPIRLRIGINAGEPIVEDDDLHGASVVIAKRLESAADEGGILVSDVVRQAVAGKDFTFEDRGEVELKGFDQPVRGWAVRWKEPV